MFHPAPDSEEDQILSGPRWLREKHRLRTSNELIDVSILAFVATRTFSSSLKLHTNRLVDVFGQVEDTLLLLLFFILQNAKLKLLLGVTKTSHTHTRLASTLLLSLINLRENASFVSLKTYFSTSALNCKKELHFKNTIAEANRL